MRQKQSRNWFLVCYSKCILDTIEKCPNIKQVAWCYHDRDILPDGSPKPPHYHILVNFHIPRRLSWFNQYKVDGDENLFCQIASCPQTCFEYLIHLNDPSKFQYKTTDIHGRYTSFSKEVEENRSALVFNELIKIVGRQQTWVGLYRLYPELIYSVKSLKSVVEQIEDEINAPCRPAVVSLEKGFVGGGGISDI